MYPREVPTMNNMHWISVVCLCAGALYRGLRLHPLAVSEEQRGCVRHVHTSQLPADRRLQ